MKPYTLHHGDCIEVMRGMAENSIDAIVCDPPYGLEFMGKEWDGADGFRRSLNKADVDRDNAFWRTSRTSPEYRAGHLFQEWCEVWAREALRVLKPGGHMLAFSGSRTSHRMVCAIEDAGFEIRDSIPWIYASGFPKSRNIAEHDMEGVDAEQWDGWGTALKPAHEPICMARKPLAKGLTVAANVLAFGTGAINIDACRVDGDDAKGGSYTVKRLKPGATLNETGGNWRPEGDDAVLFHGEMKAGRWPANIIHDGSDEVLAEFPDAPGQLADASTSDTQRAVQNVYGSMKRGRGDEPSANNRYGVDGADFSMKPGARRRDVGSAARFFYCAKASPSDRHEGLDHPGPQFKKGSTLRDAENLGDDRKGNNHPTVKPADLMAYLCRLVTPPGGVVLDMFMGSGSTGKGAMRGGFKFIGIDMTAEYIPIAQARIEHEHAKVVLANTPPPAPPPEPQLNLFEQDVA